MPPAARVAAAPLDPLPGGRAAPRTPAVSFRCGFGRNDVSAETAAKRLHRRQEFLFWDVFFNCSLEKDGMCWCRIVLRQAHCRRLAFRHYLYRSLSTSKPVNGDSIRSKVLGGERGGLEGGGGTRLQKGSPPPLQSSSSFHTLLRLRMHRTLAAEELENLIHGDAAHLFEGFFGERADMRRKEHIRQGGEGHG